MLIENSQCKLAQAQIGRYVAGETLPEDVLSSLEAHLDDCTDCRSLVREQRAALQVRAGEAESDPIDPPNLTDSFPEPEAGVGMEAVEPAVVAPGERSAPPAKLKLPAFREALRHGRTGKRKLGHPLVWSGALALVLVAMSYVAKNPSLIFGKKVSEAKTSEKSKPPVDIKAEDSGTEGAGRVDDTKHAVKAAAALDKTATEPEKQHENSQESTETIAKHTGPTSNATRSAHESPKTAPKKPYVAQETSEPSTRRSIRRQAPARPRPHTGTIKVYDAAGKPIHP